MSVQRIVACVEASYNEVPLVISSITSNAHDGFDQDNVDDFALDALESDGLDTNGFDLDEFDYDADVEISENDADHIEDNNQDNLHYVNGIEENVNEEALFAFRHPDGFDFGRIGPDYEVYEADDEMTEDDIDHVEGDDQNHVNDLNGIEENQSEEILFVLHQEISNEYDEVSGNFVINEINIGGVDPNEVFEINNIYMQNEDVHVEE